METFTIVPAVPDARELFRVAPDDYVAERTRLVKEARAAGDRALAKFYSELKRPNLSLWAVLAADDAAAIRHVVTSTTELGKVQVEGGTPTALSSATQRRRVALEALVDRAVTELAKWVSAAESRRGEIRGIVDQLSRHPDLTEAWIDGTLRDLPAEMIGFAVYADMPVAARSGGGSTVKAAVAAPSDSGTRGRATEAETPVVRPDEVRRAQRAVATTARELATVERRLDKARRAAREAEDALHVAEKDHAAAEQRHEEANATLETARALQSSGSLR